MGEERCREGFVFWEVIIVNRDIKNWVIDCLAFFLFFNFMYLFIYGCVGSSFLCEGFL